MKTYKNTTNRPIDVQIKGGIVTISPRGMHAFDDEDDMYCKALAARGFLRCLDLTPVAPVEVQSSAFDIVAEFKIDIAAACAEASFYNNPDPIYKAMHLVAETLISKSGIKLPEGETEILKEIPAEVIAVVTPVEEEAAPIEEEVAGISEENPVESPKETSGFGRKKKHR